MTQSRLYKLVHALGNGSEIQISVYNDSVPVGSCNDSASEADILDDGQQVALSYGLHDRRSHRTDT